ncbi:MAG: 2-amino-4-hydroxy-6-hydroxymethyldihydropteridine diphosphokinase [Steroidobacteraceae bacterium]
MSAWFPAYVALGSNLDDPAAQVRRGLQRLAQIARTRLVAFSRLYRTRAFGPVRQPDFVNAAAALLTQQGAAELLHSLQQIEIQSGRPEAHEKWGPRTLDLDLLVYGDARQADAALTLPHPGIAQRNFVLYPLADIAPQLQIPGLGLVAALRARTSAEGIWPLAVGGL